MRTSSSSPSTLPLVRHVVAAVNMNPKNFSNSLSFIYSSVLQHLSNLTYYLKLDHAALIVFYKFCFRFSRSHSYSPFAASRKSNLKSKKKKRNLSQNLKFLKVKLENYERENFLLSFAYLRFDFGAFLSFISLSCNL